MSCSTEDSPEELQQRMIYGSGTVLFMHAHDLSEAGDSVLLRSCTMVLYAASRGRVERVYRRDEAHPVAHKFAWAGINSYARFHAIHADQAGGAGMKVPRVRS